LFWFSVTGKGIASWFAGKKIYADADHHNPMTIALMAPTPFLSNGMHIEFSGVDEGFGRGPHLEDRAEELTK